MTGCEILGYFKNGEFRGFGGGAPTAGGLAGPQAPASPFALLSPLIADFNF